MNDRLLESYVDIIKRMSTNEARKFLKSLINGGRGNRPPVSENRMRRVVGMPGVFRNRRTGILYEYNANSGRYITFHKRRRSGRSGTGTGLSERQLLELLGRGRRSFF